MKKFLILPALALGVYSILGSQEAPVPVQETPRSSVRHVSRGDYLLETNPRQFVLSYGKWPTNEPAGYFARAIETAIDQDFVQEDEIYNQLIRAIEKRQIGLERCSNDIPSGARAQGCMRRSYYFSQLHSRMNNARKKAGKSIKPVPD